MIRSKFPAGAFLAMIAFTAALHSQTSPKVVVRAGQLFDSKAGQLLTKQVILIRGAQISGIVSNWQIEAATHHPATIV
jgi:hypothetical protein